MMHHWITTQEEAAEIAALLRCFRKLQEAFPGLQEGCDDAVHEKDVMDMLWSNLALNAQGRWYTPK